MSTTPLTQLKIRAIKIVLTLQVGQFANGKNVKTIYCCSLPDYLHADVTIQRFPQVFNNTAVVAIYGMIVEDCFALTKLNLTPMQPWYNQVQIYAGYLPDTLDSTATKDEIISAIDNLALYWMGETVSVGVDFNNVNRPLVLQCILSTQGVAVIGGTTNINAQTNLSTAIQSIITTYNANDPQIKYQLKRVFPDRTVENFHSPSANLRTIQELCEHYNYQVRPLPSSEEFTQLLDITLIGISGDTTPKVLSSDTGMIGYPLPLPFGIAVKEFFDPSRNINDVIDLQTYYTPLQGTYYVWQMQSTLQTNGEEWSSDLMLFGVSNAAVGAI